MPEDFVRRCWLAGSVLLTGLVAGCGEPPTQSEAPPPRVTVQHPVEREIIDYSEYNGWMAASETVEIRSRVRGHIDKVHFTDGQVVEKDQLLFELDPRPFQAEIDVAQGQVEVAQAQLEFSIAEEARQQELFEKKVNTKADLQKAVATRKTWDANVIAAQEEVRRRQLDLTYSRIAAPIKGKISRAQLVAGNLVNAGGSDPLLTTIVALDPIHVYFFVDERALLEYRQKNAQSTQRTHDKPLKDSQVPFEFGLETDEGFPNRGILDFAENKIDVQTGTIEVRGVVDNAEARFLPGSRVRVRIPVSDPYRAVLVPDEAVLSDQDQRYLLCLNEENVVVRRNVTLGRLLEDGLRVILPGASDEESVGPNDWVITLGLQRARVNYPVEPMDADGKPITR
uniref:Efflux RND transporter periplasmic adaptor subunit n=1 Tax=Schlesneria paludicola TaxID=360056 RepID=A0A7C2JXH7_9PLAN